MAEVHRKRLGRARKLARNEGFEALWVNDAPNVRYLSGFTGSSGYILLGFKQGYFITDSRYELQAAQEVLDLEIVIVRGRLGALLKELLGGMQVRRVGFSGPHLSYAEVQSLRRSLRGAVSFQPVKAPLSGLRALKDVEEVAAIRRAVGNAERAFRSVAGLIRPGVTEMRVAEALACELIRGTCEDAAFDIIVACGPRSALPHVAPSGRRLGRKDLMLIDWGARCGGYHSDMTRVVYQGEPAAELRNIHRVVLEARSAALEAVRPGAAAADVDKAARRVIEDAGYGEHFGHALGHGVGLEVHETPILSTLSRDVLKPGMVFTVEPGIYLPGKGGVRIEDVVHLSPDGPRVLGRLPRSGALTRP